MGTTITHGTGKAIVFATGDKTEFGKIATLTSTTKQDISPLQKELKKIGVFVAITTLGLSILLLLAGYFIQGKSIIDNLLFTASVAVAAVPEGLPTTITIALAFGVKALAKKKAIIKQLSSVETLGSTTVILSDKTGTLTKNEMTVRELHFNKDTFAEIKGIGYEPIGEIEISRPNTEPIVIGQNNTSAQTTTVPLETLEKHNHDIFESLKLIALTGTLCSEAKLIHEENQTHSVIGDPTEGAILTMVEKAGFNFEDFENKYSFLVKLPFDSSRKMMSVVVKHLHTSEILVLTKGSPQAILDKCTGIFVDGKKVDLDKETRAKILKNNEEMAKNALRVIAFAYKEMPKKERDTYTEAVTENNLTFLGLAGMIDPPRKETREAIAMTKEAGIKTYIVTGDDGFTAHAIAKQIGLVDDKNYEIITGEDLNKISDGKLKKMLSDKTKDYIFARVSPQHKLKLTNILKELGEVVAVTGDGVNDAPALKRADIGIAMGVKGTDVSKETANMVLADDSFNSIVKAIEEGRTVYQNMKKFIFYIFSGNIGELITILTAIVLNIPAPLTAILILCVNIGTDIFPALALATEPPNKDIMTRPPRKISKPIMSPLFILRFVYIGIIIGAIVLGIFIWNLYRYGWMWGESIDINTVAYMKSATMAFAALVVIQFFNAYNARSHNRSVLRLGFFKNPYIILSLVASAAILFAITEISIFKTHLKLTHLTSNEWLMVFVSSAIILAIEEIRKTFIKIKEQ
jgi:potassium/sodium efflux P-type ATPase